MGAEVVMSGRLGMASKFAVFTSVSYSLIGASTWHVHIAKLCDTKLLRYRAVESLTYQNGRLIATCISLEGLHYACCFDRV
jgi:hypothetical protein